MGKVVTDESVRIQRLFDAQDKAAQLLDEIARRASVGAGTVYRHFPTKDDLFRAVVDSRIRRIIGEGRDC